jgi:hypothetical protein
MYTYRGYRHACNEVQSKKQQQGYAALNTFCPSLLMHQITIRLHLPAASSPLQPTHDMHASRLTCSTCNDSSYGCPDVHTILLRYLRSPYSHTSLAVASICFGGWLLLFYIIGCKVGRRSTQPLQSPLQRPGTHETCSGEKGNIVWVPVDIGFCRWSINHSRATAAAAH